MPADRKRWVGSFIELLYRKMKDPKSVVSKERVVFWSVFGTRSISAEGEAGRASNYR